MAALLGGDFYSAAQVGSPWPWALLPLCVLLLPFYVVYVVVYDVAFDVANSTDPLDRSERAAIWMAGLLCFVAWPILWYAAAARWPWIAASVEDLNPSHWFYLGLLFLAHAYYAISLLVLRHRTVELGEVRFRTFLPVLIVSFAFFVGATLRATTFNPWLSLVPAFVFLFYLAVHVLHRRFRPVTPRQFSLLSIIALVSVPFVAFLVGFFSRQVRGTGVDWASKVVVAFCLGLYLSLFELWRLTAASSEGITDPRQAEQKRLRFYNATLTSHTAGLLLVPLMFVFGSFGFAFLLLIVVHALFGFVIWYAAGQTAFGGPEAESRWTMAWKAGKLLFGFSVFGIVALDVALAARMGGASVPDLYPSNISGFSASLFVAVLLAFLATPMVHYLTRGDGQHRSLRDVTIGFFRLINRRAVFRHAAVLSAFLFVATDVIYEISRYTGLGVTTRASIVFWVYAASTAVFSLIALFTDGGVTPADHSWQLNLPSEAQRAGDLHTRLGLAVLGFLQTTRIVTGMIVLLSVSVIGSWAGAPPVMVLRVGVAVALVAMASFAINDFYDEERDSVNAPQRAIPSGKLTSSQTLFIGLGLLFVGTVLGLQTLAGLELTIFLTGCVGGVLYNELVRRRPELKGLVTASLCALILVLDVLAFDLSARFLLVCLACFLFVSGRELLMDIRDLEGDRGSGVLTLAARWGETQAAKRGFCALFLSLLPLVAFLAVGGDTVQGWVAFGVYGLSLVAALLAWVLRSGRIGQGVAIDLMRVSLLAGIVVMVS